MPCKSLISFSLFISEISSKKSIDGVGRCSWNFALYPSLWSNGGDLNHSTNWSEFSASLWKFIKLCRSQAHDLQPRDFSGSADPYAKVRLLPDATKTNMWQTRIHKRTLNPGNLCKTSSQFQPFNFSFSVFDEDFVFEVRPATIGRRTLEILLYDFDAYSRHVCIGGLKISLAHVDLSDKVELWKSLGPCAEVDAKVELGDLMISLSYLPSAERLTVVVIKARNLRVFDDSRNSSGELNLNWREMLINSNCPSRPLRESFDNP